MRWSDCGFSTLVYSIFVCSIFVCSLFSVAVLCNYHLVLCSVIGLSWIIPIQVSSKCILWNICTVSISNHQINTRIMLMQKNMSSCHTLKVVLLWSYSVKVKIKYTQQTHNIAKRRHYNVTATSRHCSDVVTTLLRRCLFAGTGVKDIKVRCVSVNSLITDKRPGTTKHSTLSINDG